MVIDYRNMTEIKYNNERWEYMFSETDKRLELLLLSLLLVSWITFKSLIFLVYWRLFWL